MLQIKNLSIYLKNEMRPLVSDFTFSLNRSDKAAIIGEEGNGKSTFLKALYNLDSISDYASCTGNISKDNCIIGYLSQQLEETESAISVNEYFFSKDTFMGMDIKQLSKTADELGLNPDNIYSDRLLGSFSGGEIVKIRLLKVLSQRPDVLLFDEPTNDIDIDTLVWLEGFINKCNIPLMYVSHDETLIENTANVIIHMETRKRKMECIHTISRLSYSEYIKNRMHNLEKQDQIASMQRKEYKKQIQKWKKIHDEVERQQENISRQDPGGGRLLKKKMKSVKSMEKRFEREKEEFADFSDAEEAIFIRFYEDSYIDKSRKVLDICIDELMIENTVLAKDIELYVKGGEHIGIVGNNGVGKTTFLKEILKRIPKREGIRVGYMPQDYEDLMNLDSSCMDFLVPGMKKEDVTRARQYMGGMKFTPSEMLNKISSLSGGQKAKLFFLKMILEGCNVLVLDEPTRNLSPLSNPVIRKSLAAFPGTIISVSHDRKFLVEVCHTVYTFTKEGLSQNQSLC